MDQAPEAVLYGSTLFVILVSCSISINVMKQEFRRMQSPLSVLCHKTELNAKT